MSEFTKLGPISDFAEGTIRPVTCNGKMLAVANVSGKLQVIANTCCHKGGPLGEGTLAGNIVACPWHGWRFDVSSGACVNNPAAKIATYESKIENNDLLVKV
jgi:nitrite reductase/ring-hydroxylating ferredoxin subunit